MSISLPGRLEQLLMRDTSLSGAVQSSISTFSTWISRTNLVFFPEYTDHGPDHIARVLETAAELIRADAWQSLTPADAATLILATLLHDCAMHLTEDGFENLVTSPRPRLDGFGDKNWDALWEDFVAEAHRFSSKTLMALFGDSAPVHRPSLETHLMTGRDRKLIGEFLRRHHARLAHEIALFGVPGPEKEKVALSSSTSPELADLSGVVARSHGLPLRSCLPYLKTKYHVREYQKIHAVFLMALLRVSDYIQIQAARAPTELRRVLRLRSPVSNCEWNAHAAVRSITFNTEDPEAIEIQVLPQDVRTYLRLQDWLRDIQAEIDSSWAVLGEVYGRYTDLACLGLSIRRILSDIDETAELAAKVHYIRRRAAFGADADLLKLLVGPLYSNKPQFGIRELVQNAIDAVRELWHVQIHRPDLKNADLADQEADVVLALENREDGSCWLTISDRGIGMTAETVCEYFLKAGASFRTSQYWQKRFQGEDGKSQVLRSGRFGIGMLAAFLLGQEIQVRTRHAEAPPEQGVAFIAHLDDDLIELKWTHCPIGTVIKIPITNQSIRDELMESTDEWDWYSLPSPSVVRVIRSRSKPQPEDKYDLGSIEGRIQSCLEPLPAAGSALPPHWHRLKPQGFEEIHWSYALDHRLDCNGIRIFEPHSRAGPLNLSFLSGLITLASPSLSVFDPDAKLPLDLARTKLAGTPSFEDEVWEDVARDFFAFVLLYAPTGFMTDPAHYPAYWTSYYPGLRSNPLVAPWIATDQGVLIAENGLIRLAGITSLLIAPMMNEAEVLNLNDVRLSRGRIPCVLDRAGPHYFLNFSNEFLGSARLLAMEDAEPFDHITRHRFSVESSGPGWTLYRAGTCPAPVFDYESVAARMKVSLSPAWLGFFIEWYPPQSRQSELSWFAECWQELVGVPIIPYDRDERRRRFAAAFERLAPYIEAHTKAARSPDAADLNGG